ncbi:hypothetical protein BU24DRAFT_222410 [Aaosphaeria arxii CBS 175.79]|uniref:Uncharacterized protein n=1 Tax=Aaosphaeria arxii CBS 175.79 TaxID=1450172 RepID=A0A6A5XNJ2_9PLEO|nr:uncharacterized protein BU24DRAFT_222410 [Aaosphaeria arxii CBS 175.79]KAF2014808.1 hypothetical protein BU24DRAFT_222410 [Aaosphaeria arxii CBS 175.79]
MTAPWMLNLAFRTSLQCCDRKCDSMRQAFITELGGHMGDAILKRYRGPKMHYYGVLTLEGRADKLIARTQAPSAATTTLFTLRRLFHFLHHLTTAVPVGNSFPFFLSLQTFFSFSIPINFILSRFIRPSTFLSSFSQVPLAVFISPRLLYSFLIGSLVDTRATRSLTSN